MAVDPAGAEELAVQGLHEVPSLKVFAGQAQAATTVAAAPVDACWAMVPLSGHTVHPPTAAAVDVAFPK